MTPARRASRLRVAEELRRRIAIAAIDAARSGSPTPKELHADLEREGFEVSLRTVQRIYTAAKPPEDTSGAWHITDARSAEELEHLLPVVTARVEEGRGDSLSKDEAQIVLAISRAVPAWRPWEVDYIARHYRAARDGEVSAFGGPMTPWSVAELEVFIAFAHLDGAVPGSLKRAIERGQTSSIGFARSMVLRVADGQQRKARRGEKR